MHVFQQYLILKDPFVIEEFRVDNFNDLQIIGEKIKSSFDITKTLRLKASIVKEDMRSDRLLITVHHLFIYGFSWRYLLDDLYDLYSAAMNDMNYTLIKSKKCPELVRLIYELCLLFNNVK